MKMPKVWEIVKKFKDMCSFRGWKTSENEDWVEMDNHYHNFLWARDIHPSSFKKVVSSKKCVIQEGLSYRVVEASYTAWLFSKAPSETLLKTVAEDPTFYGKVALYDLSPILEGRNVCLRANHTDSPVFEEFERFLRDELKVKIKPLPPISSVSFAEKSFAVEELA